MADHFDPSEPRDPHGKWIKLAQGLKKLSQADHGTVTKAIGELPKGGHGNRTSIKGVEIRRHQSGAVNVKIGGESRQYSSHEDAARAVIDRKHVPVHGQGPSGEARMWSDKAKERRASGDKELARRYGRQADTMHRIASKEPGMSARIVGEKVASPGIKSGDVVAFASHGGDTRGRRGQVHFVRVGNGPVTESDTHVTFSGSRVRPENHSVTFGNDKVHVARKSDIHVVRKAERQSEINRVESQKLDAARRLAERQRQVAGSSGYKPPGQGRGRTSLSTSTAARQRYQQAPISPSGQANMASEYAARAGNQGVKIEKGASGNFGVSNNGKRVGIVMKEANGTYTYEHKRGDQLAGFKTLAEAAQAMIERDQRGESVGGRGETMRQYAGIGSAADERAAARRRQALEMLQRQQQRTTAREQRQPGDMEHRGSDAGIGVIRPGDDKYRPVSEQEKIQSQISELEKRVQRRALSARLGGRGAATSPAAQRDEERLQHLYDRLVRLQRGGH